MHSCVAQRKLQYLATAPVVIARQVTQLAWQTDGHIDATHGLDANYFLSSPATSTHLSHLGPRLRCANTVQRNNVWLCLFGYVYVATQCATGLCDFGHYRTLLSHCLACLFAHIPTFL